MSGFHVEAMQQRDEFYDETLSNLDSPAFIFQNKTFENCRFVHANFRETKFITCRFVDCEFESCNLGASQFDDSVFNETVFIDSKVMGVNWTKLKWPFIQLSNPLQFLRSDISHSSFYNLALKDIVIEECKAHDVDFRQADLTNANLMRTDFAQSQFIHTKLISANFRDAINYRIDPINNDIRKAKFSIPEVVNLLRCFDIEID